MLDYFSGMVKYLIIVINSLAVFLYSLFSGDNGITVTSTIPATIKAGQEVAIELKVTKAQMNGFAKLQLELPEGIAAKESESQGANYTYNSGVAKWVWASLPSESEIVIKVVLISDVAATLGAKTIRAKFSFVENNAKQVVEMTPAEITIMATDQSEAVATTAPTVTEKTEAAKETTPEKSEQEKEQVVEQSATPQVAGNNEPLGNITVSRTIVKGSNEDYTIYLKIKKGSTKGFARYSDDLTGNVTVKAVKTEGSSFSVGDGKLKFVWVNVPEKEELNLEYVISGTAAEPVVLNGEYSYLEENQSKKFMLSADRITLASAPPRVSETETKEEPVTSKPLDEEEKTKATETASKKTDSQKNVTSTEEKMQESMNKKAGVVNYCVQIGAFTKSNVSAGKLREVFKITESVKSEMQGGFSKFMVGSHDEYKGARDHRELVKTGNGVKSAFVVAYNGSTRITVQEALMITNQKWYK